MIKQTVQKFKSYENHKTQKEYTTVCERIEELLEVVDNETATNDKNLIELDLLSDLVANYPVHLPTLIETIKLRMYELNLNQVKLSNLF